MRPARLRRTAALVLALGGLATAATAQETWMLMGRHGECVTLAEAGQRRPEFRGITGPDDFIAKLRADGTEVGRRDVQAGKTRTVLVEAPTLGLSLIFVPASLCP